MNKYFSVVANTWNEIFTYRLSFVMWRIRNVLSLFTIYFLWLSIIPGTQIVFGYSKSLMLTYVIGASLVSSIILSTRTHEIGENINSGDLSSFLTKPINYFGYWFSRDIGDKSVNLFFSIIELSIVFLIIRPPFFLQTNIENLMLFTLAIFFGIILYFLLGSILGMIGFWSPDVWAPRFIFFILINFFAGALFPIDVFPKIFVNFFNLLPFPYLLYFPLKIYLGQLQIFQIYQGMFISIIWIVGLWIIKDFIWNKGIRMYTAYGN